MARGLCKHGQRASSARLLQGGCRHKRDDQRSCQAHSTAEMVRCMPIRFCLQVFLQQALSSRAMLALLAPGLISASNAAQLSSGRCTWRSTNYIAA